MVVTEGLRERVSPQELEAVLGHGLSHIANLDGSVLLTGAPEQLMSALQKITGDLVLIPNRDLRAMKRWEVAMDHPPLEKRLARLEEMARELGKAA